MPFSASGNRKSENRDAIPREFIPKLKDVKVRGKFGWELDFELDSADPESLTYEARPSVSGYKLLSIGKEINFRRVRDRLHRWSWRVRTKPMSLRRDRVP